MPSTAPPKNVNKASREGIECVRALTILKLLDILFEFATPPNMQYFRVVYLNANECALTQCEDCKLVLEELKRPLRSGNLLCAISSNLRAQFENLFSGRMNIHPVELATIIRSCIICSNKGCVYCKPLIRPYEKITGVLGSARVAHKMYVAYDDYEEGDEYQPSYSRYRRETQIDPKDELI